MRRLSALLGFGALLGAAAAPSAPASAAEIYQKTTYFAVEGATLAEIDRALSRSGPKIEGTGARHPGATEVKFDGEVSYRRTDRGCTVGETDLKLRLNMMLPRWRRPAEAPERMLVVWRTLAADIKRHEERHAEIAKEWLKRMEMAVRNLAPESTCAAMERTVNRVTHRYLSQHEAAQQRFDMEEGQAVNQRLRRALNANLERYGD